MIPMDINASIESPDLGKLHIFPTGVTEKIIDKWRFISNQPKGIGSKIVYVRVSLVEDDGLLSFKAESDGLPKAILNKDINILYKLVQSEIEFSENIRRSLIWEDYLEISTGLSMMNGEARDGIQKDSFRLGISEVMRAVHDETGDVFIMKNNAIRKQSSEKSIHTNKQDALGVNTEVVDDFVYVKASDSNYELLSLARDRVRDSVLHMVSSLENKEVPLTSSTNRQRECVY